MDGIIFTAADRDQRLAWATTDDCVAQLGDVAGGPAIVFMGNPDPAPKFPCLTYEEGVEIAVVLAGDDDELLRAAMEEPDNEDPIADAFVVTDPLLVLDTTEGVDGQLRTFALSLRAGTYCVDLREAGSLDEGAQVLAFFPSDDED